MQESGGMNRRNLNVAHAGVIVSAVLWMLLGVVPGSQSPAAAQGGGGGRTYALQKVTPHVFRGNVRDLPKARSKPKSDFEPHGPSVNKQGASTVAPLAPSLAAAPMPGASQNFAGVS